MITVSWGSVVTAAAVIGAVVAIVTFFAKVVRWMDNQKRQDTEISTIKNEQTILVYGILSCLQGLKEQGCNGPVTEAINKIEKHINQKAHE